VLDSEAMPGSAFGQYKRWLLLIEYCGFLEIPQLQIHTQQGGPARDRASKSVGLSDVCVQMSKPEPLGSSQRIELNRKDIV
jgi:hypothetical protein